MQHEITQEQFEEDIDDYLFCVADHNDILIVDTEYGKAIVISEEEWLALRSEFLESKRYPKNAVQAHTEPPPPQP